MKPSVYGAYCAGDMWSFRSEAQEDLTRIYDMVSDIPRCDTKKEIVDLIRRSVSALEMMKSKVKAAGTDYLLKDAVE